MLFLRTDVFFVLKKKAGQIMRGPAVNATKKSYNLVAFIFKIATLKVCHCSPA
jgi:hypothetical protein